MDEQKSTYAVPKGLMIGLGGALIVILVFAFGMFVGEQKARFSLRWGQNYYREFGGPPMAPPGGPRGFFGGHGDAGVVVKRKAGRLVLRSPLNAEKIVLISNSTYIVKGREKIGIKDIKEGSHVVVLGSPDSKGRIKARLIRVLEPGTWKESMWRRKDFAPPLPLPL